MEGPREGAGSAAGTDALLEAIAAEMADRVEPSERALAREFVYIFYANARADLLQRRDAATHASTALDSFRFLQRSRNDRVDVEVLSSGEAGGPTGRPVTLIRTQLTDRPFVVDTIREHLNARDLVIDWFIYPVMRVVRDSSNRILELGPAAEGGPLESLTYCEAKHVGAAAEREEIATAIRQALEDVVRATDDFQPMVEAVHDTIRYLDGRAARVPARDGEIGEVQEFLRWLVDGGFVFLGYRSYSIIEDTGRRAIAVDEGSGLGILRDEHRSSFVRPVPLETLAPGLRERVEGGPLLITSKTNAPSTVHRRARMDYIGVKKLDDEGRVIGERRFVGLFTSKAYAEDAERIPILREKLRTILANAGAMRGTHDYKEIITIFNSMPKEEVFLASAEEIGGAIRTVLQLYNTDEVKVILRPDPLGRGVSVLAILPRDVFSGSVRKAVERTLTAWLGGTVLNSHVALSNGGQARLHFYVGTPAGQAPPGDPAELEHRIRLLVRTWADYLQLELERDRPAEDARRLAQRYAREFSAEYQAVTPPGVAREDIVQLEAMARADQGVAIRMFATEPPDPTRATQRYTHLRLYLIGERLVLSEFMPILDNAGLRVLFVRPFELAGEEVPRSTIYVFAIQDARGEPIDVERQGQRLSDALLAVRAGEAANDELNRLVLRAGLHWREADLLRAYCEYAFQLGAVPSRRTLGTALTTHIEPAALLLRLFATKFDPSNGLDIAQRQAAATRLRGDFGAALARVESLAEDRALRQLLGLLDATVRTNFYRHGGIHPTVRSGGAPYVSLKFSGRVMQAIADSRLLFEVWVYSSRMAGVHLRTAPVARGGIRLSDRPDDFRKEVLGLVRTQAVKNAVIVPGGSKGAFICMRTPADPDARAVDVAEQYRTLMRGLLDITDNLVDGEVRTPEGVIAHDAPDPYLVVAADKGTAHLPDVANEVAAEYGFWLADAFASGGSRGYDHKALGITARGAWECVRRHFRELGHDTQSEPFTVIGIGDMSGDVFGNGMLLSEQIRLIAAFDHRHIMVDPDPDAARSFRERQRLFHGGRTSWNDYDRTVLSEGGFIVPRGAKSVPLTAQARQALGLPDTTDALDGEALIRAVLRAPADLLWNGGIGTYVKASEERHADVGDPANDAVRVDAPDLRVKVIGEGGNLGLTQAARVQYALRGGRANTDALDNAAGVDLSDHEVNLKILLGAAVAAGSLDFDGRNRLIGELAPEVVELTLQDTRSQSLAVSLDEQRGRESSDDFHALMRQLEREGVLDRAAERLPSLEVLQERRAGGGSLTRPELALLLAYAKLWLKRDLLDSTLPDDALAEAYLHAYFPQTAVRVAGAAALREHRLSREIIATQVVNDLVDLMGAAFVNRVKLDTGATAPDIVRAWLVAARLCGTPDVRAWLSRLERERPAPEFYSWLRGLDHVLERAVRWVLVNVSADTPADVVIAEHEDGLERLRDHFHEVVPAPERAGFEARIREASQFTDVDALPQSLITVSYLDHFLEILRVARETGTDPIRSAQAYYRISDVLGIPWLRDALAQEGRSRWDQRLIHGLLDDIGRAHRRLTAAVVRGSGPTEPLEEHVARMLQRIAAGLAEFGGLLDEIRAEGSDRDLTALAVAVGQLRALSRRA